MPNWLIELLTVGYINDDLEIIEDKKGRNVEFSDPENLLKMIKIEEQLQIYHVNISSSY
jgi:hypothetical protein